MRSTPPLFMESGGVTALALEARLPVLEGAWQSMKKTDYGSVKMLLAIENPIVRQGLQNVLQHEGFLRPAEVASHDRLLAILVEQTFDVIVTATEITGEFIPPYIGQLRRGGLVHHPLPIVIELLTSSDGDYVRQVIDSGPDDLLQLPVSPGQLLARLAVLTEKRKPFVVTSDYVGPDRRQSLRAGAAPVPLVEVPNPLAMRTRRQPDEEMERDIDACVDRLRQMRIERFAFELQWLLRAIRQLFQPEQNDSDKLQTFCERIKTLLFNLPRLLPTSAVATIEPLSDRLVLGANIIQKSGFSADATVLNGLGNVVNALTKAMLATLSAEVLEAAGYARDSGVK
jgi:CheY-like chemotaxis protein